MASSALSAIREIETAAGRVERSIDEASSRLRSLPVDDQVEGLAEAIRRALDETPERLRSVVIEMLCEIRASPETTLEDRDLLAEIAALRAQVKEGVAAAKPVKVPESANTGTAAALLGDNPGAATSAENIATVAKLFRGFVEDLAAAFAAIDRDRRGSPDTAKDELHQAIRCELSGDASLGAYLGGLKAQVGGLATKLPAICSDGSRALLEAIEPAVVEDEAQRSGGLSLGPFKYRDLWLAFERCYRELSHDQDVYERFFDGQVRRHLHRSRTRS